MSINSVYLGCQYVEDYELFSTRHKVSTIPIYTLIADYSIW